MYSRSSVITRDMVLRDKSFSLNFMSPSDFCQKWIPILYKIMPDERGYKAACIKELVSVTGLTESTIKNSWGADMANYPKSVENTLYWANISYTVNHALGFRPNRRN